MSGVSTELTLQSLENAVEILGFLQALAARVVALVYDWRQPAC